MIGVFIKKLLNQLETISLKTCAGKGFEVIVKYLYFALNNS